MPERCDWCGRPTRTAKDQHLCTISGKDYWLCGGCYRRSLIPLPPPSAELCKGCVHEHEEGADGGSAEVCRSCCAPARWADAFLRPKSTPDDIGKPSNYEAEGYQKPVVSRQATLGGFA